MDGVDEISLSAKTYVCEINNGVLKTFELDPKDYGMRLCSPAALTGGEAQENAAIAKSILKGEKSPKTDIVVLNSAVVLYLSGKAPTITDGVRLAQDAIDSGNAYRQMEQFIAATNQF